MAGSLEAVVDSSQTPGVRGFLHRTAGPSGDALVLTHGAGSDCNAPLLVALAEAFADAGVSVLRCNLPFRQLRPHGPPRGSDADDRAGLRRALQLCGKLLPGRVFLGGHSYGGRQATILAAEEAPSAEGLLILSYPLHPPGKPDQLRVRHLSNLRMPALFVSGSTDPFGSPAELQAALRGIPGSVSLLLLEGVGHDLGFGRRVRAGMQDLPQRIVHAFRQSCLAPRPASPLSRTM